MSGHGYEHRTYNRAEPFLSDIDTSKPGIAVVDVLMDGMDGLKLQREMAERFPSMPVIIMSAHGNIPMAVAAVQDGALNFLEKPFDNEQLIKILKNALSTAESRFAASQKSAEAQALIENLTPREQDVFHLLAKGQTTKVIATELSISAKTVEIHRGRVFDKLAVRTVAEVIQIAEIMSLSTSASIRASCTKST